MLVQQVQEHIKQQGLKAVGNLTGDNIASQLVEGILDVYSKYREMIASVFLNDQQFSSALDIACVAMVNHRPHSEQPCESPKLLAEYCDALLKKPMEGTGEAEVDEKLSHCITIFNYLDDTDLFQELYSPLLENRLTHQLSFSIDAEKTMINRLEQVCQVRGYEFTINFDRIVSQMRGVLKMINVFLNEENQRIEQFFCGLV